MSSTLQVIESGPGEPAFNMAYDEALLRLGGGGESGVLRFYRWTTPAATFGYSQSYAEVAQRTLLRPLIRRPTGGGIVPHDRDWTYSLTVPPGHSWYHLKARESYRTIHGWIQRAFEALDVEAELALVPRLDAPGQCFIGYEQFDVLWRGQKIAGAAQRRTRHGMLIQGSIQPPPRVERGLFERAMLNVAPQEFFTEITTSRGREETVALARSLVETRYGRTDYNEGR
jgi:lipoate-protein ligase A